MISDEFMGIFKSKKYGLVRKEITTMSLVMYKPAMLKIYISGTVVKQIRERGFIADCEKKYPLAQKG